MENQETQKIQASKIRLMTSDIYPEATTLQLAEALLQDVERDPKRPWELEHPVVTFTKPAQPGVHTYYLIHRWWNPFNPLVLLVRRRDDGRDGKAILAPVGGFQEMRQLQEAPESQRDGAVRETSEELVYADGTALFSFETERLHAFDALIDGDIGRPSPQSFFFGFLSAGQANALKNYLGMLKSDDYRAEVFKASHNEVKDAVVLPLSEAVKIATDKMEKPLERIGKARGPRYQATVVQRLWRLRFMLPFFRFL